MLPWSIDASVQVSSVQRNQIDVVENDAAQRTEHFLRNKTQMKSVVIVAFKQLQRNATRFNELKGDDNINRNRTDSNR